ncbi:MAG: hypothetical protein KatS3mg028_0277 [Bacteroidia bacterium]|nr:MAG: hypothetical protein KatS3mg028_0277 [Bacteroidia bacterium]
MYWDDEVCMVEKDDLIPFEADLTNYPDLFPPLWVLAAGIQGTSVLSGASRLYNKESNRAEVLLVKELSNVGADIEIQERRNDHSLEKDTSTVACIHSHNDHRIAMAGSHSRLHCKK